MFPSQEIQAQLSNDLTNQSKRIETVREHMRAFITRLSLLPQPPLREVFWALGLWYLAPQRAERMGLSLDRLQQWLIEANRDLQNPDSLRHSKDVKFFDDIVAATKDDKFIHITQHIYWGSVEKIADEVMPSLLVSNNLIKLATCFDNQTSVRKLQQLRDQGFIGEVPEAQVASPASEPPKQQASTIELGRLAQLLTQAIEDIDPEDYLVPEDGAWHASYHVDDASPQTDGSARTAGRITRTSRSDNLVGQLTEHQRWDALDDDMKAVVFDHAKQEGRHILLYDADLEATYQQWGLIYEVMAIQDTSIRVILLSKETDRDLIDELGLMPFNLWLLPSRPVHLTRAARTRTIHSADFLLPESTHHAYPSSSEYQRIPSPDISVLAEESAGIVPMPSPERTQPASSSSSQVSRPVSPTLWGQNYETTLFSLSAAEPVIYYFSDDDPEFDAAIQASLQQGPQQ